MENDIGTFIVIGPSLDHASRFITRIAGERVCRYFYNRNGLVPMIGFHSYTSKLLQCKICLIQIASIYDITNYLPSNKLLCLLQYTYFQAVSKGFRPKGFIITESNFENRSAIINTLNKLFEVCGKELKNSTVVIERKLCKERCQNNNSNIISEECERLGVPCIKWRNSLDKPYKKTINTQITNLIAILKNMQPYYAVWMTELEEEIKTAPKIEIRSTKEENDESDLDLDEMRNRLRSVSNPGCSMFFLFCRLTRRGVVKASRRAFGLISDRVSLPVINLPSKRERNQ